MDDAKWERLALLGGPAFVVLSFVGGFMPGTPPAPDASAQKIFDFFEGNETAVGIGSFLGALAGLFLLLWAGSLWRAMSRAEGGQPRLAVVAALGLAMAGALALVSGAVNATVALRIDTIGAPGAQLLWTLSGVLAASLYLPMAVQVLAVTLLAWHSGFLPKWLVGLGAATVVAGLVASYGIASDGAAFFSAALMGYLLWSAWILAVSFVLRSAPTPAASGA